MGMFLNMRQCSQICGNLSCRYILITFLLTYKMDINYAPIINRINYLLEKVLRLKNDQIVKEIYLKSLETKKR